MAKNDILNQVHVHENSKTEIKEFRKKRNTTETVDIYTLSIVIHYNGELTTKHTLTSDLWHLQQVMQFQLFVYLESVLVHGDLLDLGQVVILRLDGSSLLHLIPAESFSDLQDRKKIFSLFETYTLSLRENDRDVSAYSRGRCLLSRA